MNLNHHTFFTNITLNDYILFRNWLLEMKKSKAAKRKPSLFKAIFKTFIRGYIYDGILLGVLSFVFKYVHFFINFKFIFFIFPYHCAIRINVEHQMVY